MRARFESLRMPASARCTVSARVPRGRAAVSMARSRSTKLNFSGKQKYSVSRRYAACERAGKSISASSSPKPALRTGSAGSASQCPPSACTYAATVRTSSASRSAAHSDGSPSRNRRSAGSASASSPRPSQVMATRTLMLAVAPAGKRTVSGAPMIGENAARVIASGATVTGYTVRNVHSTPRTGRVLKAAPRPIVVTPVCWPVATAPSICAIEHDGNGRR